MTIVHSTFVTIIASANGRGSLCILCGARLYLLPRFEFVEWNNTFLQPQRRVKTICTAGSMLMPRMSKLHTCLVSFDPDKKMLI